MRHFSNMSYSAIKATAKLQNLIGFLVIRAQLLTNFCHYDSDCYGYSLTKFTSIAMSTQRFQQKVHWNQLSCGVVFQHQRSFESSIVRAHVFLFKRAPVSANDFLVMAVATKLFKKQTWRVTAMCSLTMRMWR